MDESTPRLEVAQREADIGTEAARDPGRRLAVLDSGRVGDLWIGQFEVGSGFWSERFEPDVSESSAAAMARRIGILEQQAPREDSSPRIPADDPFNRLRLFLADQLAQLTEEAADAMAAGLAAREAWTGITESSPEDRPEQERKKSDRPEWRDVLSRLSAVHAELEADYRDVARCEKAWRELQQLTAGALWQAVEDLDRHRRQLANVLDSAVSRLQAFQLTPAHLAAVEKTLEGLAAAEISKEDVFRFEDLWEDIGVETVPTLGEAFEEWLRLSGPDSDDDG